MILARFGSGLATNMVLFWWHGAGWKVEIFTLRHHILTPPGPWSDGRSKSLVNSNIGSPAPVPTFTHLRNSGGDLQKF